MSGRKSKRKGKPSKVFPLYSNNSWNRKEDLPDISQIEDLCYRTGDIVKVEVDYDVDVEVDDEVDTVASIPSPSPTTASKYDQDVHHDCQHCRRDFCCEHVLNNSRSNIGELYVNE